MENVAKIWKENIDKKNATDKNISDKLLKEKNEKIKYERIRQKQYDDEYLKECKVLLDTRLGNFYKDIIMGKDVNFSPYPLLYDTDVKHKEENINAYLSDEYLYSQHKCKLMKKLLDTPVADGTSLILKDVPHVYFDDYDDGYDEMCELMIQYGELSLFDKISAIFK